MKTINNMYKYKYQIDHFFNLNYNILHKSKTMGLKSHKKNLNYKRSN